MIESDFLALIAEVSGIDMELQTIASSVEQSLVADVRLFSALSLGAFSTLHQDCFADRTQRLSIAPADLLVS